MYDVDVHLVPVAKGVQICLPALRLGAGVLEPSGRQAGGTLIRIAAEASVQGILSGAATALQEALRGEIGVQEQACEGLRSRLVP